MKLFRCGDVVPGCAATFRAVEEDEILGAVGEHAVRDHGVQPDEAMVARVRRLVVVEPEP